MSEQEQEIASSEAEGRPDWLLPQFKTAEDQARSYAAAQSEMTRTRQELKEIQSQTQEILAQQQQQYQAQQAQGDQWGIQNQLLEAVASGDPEQELAAMAWLAETAAQKYAQQQAPQPQGNNAEVIGFAANQTMQAKYDDWNEIAMDVKALVEQDPELLRVNDTTTLAQAVQGLERVYKIAKADRVLSQGESVLAVENEANRLAKQQAQTITGSSQRPATSTAEDEYWQSIRETQLGSVRVGRL